MRLSTSRELHAAAAKQGVNFMDVAISGSTPAVEAGTVTLLAGGDAELFEAAKPIFQALASHWFLMGPPGSGTSMKLVVNTLLGVEMQAIAEAVALGEAAGIDRTGCWMSCLRQLSWLPLIWESWREQNTTIIVRSLALD